MGLFSKAKEMVLGKKSDENDVPRDENYGLTPAQIEMKDKVVRVVSLAMLAGFRISKVRQCIETIPDFSKFDKKDYEEDRLMKTFMGIRGRRSQAHKDLLEEVDSAAHLATMANNFFCSKVEGGKPETDTQIKNDEAREFVARWRHEIWAFSYHNRDDLKAKFEPGIDAAAAKLVNGKEVNNLEKFESESPARRKDLDANAAYKNNRQVLTRSALLTRSSRGTSPITNPPTRQEKLPQP